MNTYNDLYDFLTKHNAKENGKIVKEITHTRIGSPENNIYGGSYHISNEELEIFYKLYYDSVFIQNNKEYLTEKQLEEDGPILIDLDFRYEFEIEERQHNYDDIQDIITLYLDELKNILLIEEKKKFPIFIMQKPNINRVLDKKITKDGIHIIIGIQMDHILQQILREKIIEKISEISSLPLINDWKNVLDEGISKGNTNWQMYGSQKPNNESYCLNYIIECEIDPIDNEFMTENKNIDEFDLENNLCLLSARYNNHIKFEIKPNILDYYNKIKNNKSKVNKNKKIKTRTKLIFEEDKEDSDEINENISINSIINKETLDKAINIMIQNLKVSEYSIKEIHEYTQILPEKYYQPGSHLLNRQVAFALKNTDERLFISWIGLRAKAVDFDYNTIPSLYYDWKHHFNKKSNEINGITKRSIIYWAKQDAFEEYEIIKKNNINYFLEETILDATDFDFATILYYMFKDKYVCSSINNKKWYIYKKHRWEKDEGQRLRLAISRDLYQLYQDKMQEYLSQLQSIEKDDNNYEIIDNKVKKIASLCIKLKKTNDKNNIMREAMEIFYDKDFVKNMDANPYLMCFTNGVVDFKNKVFREGYPQDYITKCTGIPYVYLNLNENKGNENKGKQNKTEQQNQIIIEDIIKFMKQLFPEEELCSYVWDHLSSCLIGIKREQVFNIYLGSGSNGKSILTDLMSQGLGEYKGTVPISLVTEKRVSTGGTSSEVIQLKGVRYAVMQEPSKNAIINEGLMKELTGGDPIQARALYSDSEIFIPQFSLVVCTNTLFEIKSNDDGTWRRMKVVDFKSKFIDENEIHSDDTKYIFPKDKTLKEKLPLWSPIFISMLVNRAFETEGIVKDCPQVISASNKYRQDQDNINAFINENIIKDNCVGIGRNELSDRFRIWFKNNIGEKVPKLNELIEAMNKKFGERNKKGKWSNIKFICEDIEDNDQLEDDDD